MVSMGSVWDRTAEFLSDNLGGLLPIALAAIFLPKMIAANLAQLSLGASESTAMLLSLLGFAMTLVVYWGQLAVTALAIDPQSGAQAHKLAVRRYPSALLVMLLLFVAVILVFAPYGVILAMAGVDLTALQAGAVPNIPEDVALTSSVYILFALGLLIWIVPRLSLVLPVVVAEGRFGGAIVRSWKLTRGVALKLLGVMILYIVVSVISEVAATSVFGVVMRLIAGSGDGLSLASVLTTIAGAMVSTAFTVLGTAFAAKLYIALLARHQAAAAQ